MQTQTRVAQTQANTTVVQSCFSDTNDSGTNGSFSDTNGGIRTAAVFPTQTDCSLLQVHFKDTTVSLQNPTVTSTMYMAILVTLLWTVLFMTWPKTKTTDQGVSTSAQYKLFRIRAASKHGKQRRRFREHCQNVCGPPKECHGTIRRRSSRCTDVTRELLGVTNDDYDDCDEALVMEGEGVMMSISRGRC